MSGRRGFPTVVLAAAGIVAGTLAPGAALPLVEEQRIVASDGLAGERFGRSLAVDGDTLVVGAYLRNAGEGAAYVFRRDRGRWEEEATLTPSGALGAATAMGSAAALQGDRLLLGGGSQSGLGAAYVFERDEGSWTEAAALRPADVAAGDWYGGYVALDGDRAAVSAHRQDSNRGAVYVFVRGEGGWTQEAKITAPDGVAGDYFGQPVGLSGDTLVAGAGGRSGLAGAAYVFRRTGSGWEQEAILVPSDPHPFDIFGNTVAVDGDTIAVGAYRRDPGGAVYFFERTGASWSERAVFGGVEPPGPAFLGSNLALDGDTALASASILAARVFVRSADGWAERATLAPAASAGGASAVALDGETAVLASMSEDASAGSAYLFRLLPDSTVTGGDLEFERCAQGLEPVPLVITVASEGARDLRVGAVAIVQGDTADFRVLPGGAFPPSDLAPTLEPGTRATFEVSYAPRAPGVHAATLRVLTDDPDGGTVDVALRGEAARCLVSPRAGTVGTEVRIAGAGFGARRGKVLLLGGPKPVALRVLAWDAASRTVTGVVVKVPPAGTLDLVVAPPGVAPIVEEGGFVILPPAVVGVAPSSGAAGAEVAVQASALGTKRGTAYLRPAGALKATKCRVTAWPAIEEEGTGLGEVRFLVPRRFAPGTVCDLLVVNGAGTATAAGVFTIAP